MADGNDRGIGSTAIVYGDGDNGDVWAGNSSTTASVSVGSSLIGSLETVDDVDWIAVNLVAGETYTISLSGTGTNALSDPYLRLWAPGSTSASNGVLVASNDDGGPGLNSQLTYTATTTGTYYIDVQSFANLYSGDYVVNVQLNSQPWTYDQIAEQLRLGYWQWLGSDYRAFNVGGDNAITVDISSLSVQYQNFALEALDTWSDILGVNFIQVASGAEIVFQSTGTGAYSTSSVIGNTIVSSIVNVEPGWADDDYTLQTFIHEIGHALGLGHAGNYNGTATYPDDALYVNDSWQASIMSYFSQTENTYVNASFAYLLTPMMADILAIQALYGVSTTTRTGDTVYGYNSNAEDRYNLDLWDGVTSYAFTIYDSGGVDTIDLSGSSTSNVVNLTPGTFSDTLGYIGNLGIAFGVVIENVIGGSGGETITGNSVANQLVGNAGNDTIYGGAGNDHIFGNTGNDTLDGQDGNDSLWGGLGNDSIAGGTGADWLLGNGGNDVLDGGSDDDRLYGGDGNDTLLGGTGNDQLWGDDGWDSLSGGDGNDILRGGLRGDTLQGDAGNDRLYGEAGWDILNGGDGHDQLYGGSGQDTLRGGLGQDRLFGDSGNDVLYGDDGWDLLRGGADDDQLYGGLLGDTLYGDDGDDVVAGEEGWDLLLGGRGNDMLLGGAGVDRLFGNENNDYIDGGANNDRLWGGLGYDTFAFADGFGNDVIYDFRPNVDRIDLSGVTAITSWSDLLASHLNIGSNGYAVITDGANSIELVGITSISQLDQNDFIFFTEPL